MFTNVFFNYLFGSLLAFIVHYSTLFLLISVFGSQPLFATSMGFLIGTAVSYIYNKYYTFTGDRSFSATLTRFFIVAIIGFAINFLIFSYLVAKLFLHYVFAQLLATIMVVIWSFGANRYWTFSDRNKTT